MVSPTIEKAPDVITASGIFARLVTRPLVWFSLISWMVLALSVVRIAESDIWYHLRNAQYLVQQGSVVRADLYTFTSSGAPLIDYEWLSELCYYAAYQLWGQRGLLAVYATLLVLIYGGVYYLACRRGANHVEAALVTLLGVALGSYSFGPRMMHFGWLCLVGVMILLERFDRHPRIIWFLPPLFCIWINLHGSWVFGLVVIGATILGGLGQGEWGIIAATRWSRDQLRSLTAATIACVAALFVNPYGARLVWYPFDLLFRQQSQVRVVVEWESVNFHNAYGKLALLMIIGLLALAWLRRVRWRLHEVLLIVFALWASLTHVRFLGFASIILVPTVAGRLRMFSGSAAGRNRPLLNIALVLLMMGAMIKTVPSSATLDSVIDREFPTSALQFMKEKRIGGPLFHAYDFGGFIEWHAPTIKTFADGRTDIFVYNGVLDDYLRIVSLDDSFALLDKYGIDYVLYSTGAHLTYLLDHSTSWRPIHRDATTTLFERISGAAVNEPVALR
jgi:hypothetical protein